LEHRYAELAERFRAVITVIDPGPRYNIAPTQLAAVIVSRAGKRYLRHYRWGLIPHWAERPSIGNRLINARAETASRLPAFRDAFIWRRCIVPATRFYEWQRQDGLKLPYSILRADGLPLSFAGLWSSWQNPTTGDVLRSCAILTRRANADLAEIHHRMPVILDDDWATDAWLDPAVIDRTQLQAVLAHTAGKKLLGYPISTLVNDYRNDTAAVIAPAPGLGVKAIASAA
jgi:putative SOS response-associated peptidase YedK